MSLNILREHYCQKFVAILYLTPKGQDFHCFWTWFIRGQTGTQGSMGRDPTRGPQGRI